MISFQRHCLLFLVVAVLSPIFLPPPVTAGDKRCVDFDISYPVETSPTDYANHWLAEAHFTQPTDIQVTLRDGVITNSSMQMSRYQAQWLNSDVHVDISCGDNQYIRGPGELLNLKIFLADIDNERPGLRIRHGIPYRPPSRRQDGVKFYDVTYPGANFASIDDLYAVCPKLNEGRSYDTVSGRQSPSHGTLHLSWRVTFCCGKKDKYGVVVRKDLVGIPVSVFCNDTRRARTSPLRFVHTCPEGYFVAGTGKRTVEDESPDAPPCVPQGTGRTKACPYVYSRATTAGQWTDQETILTHQNGIGNEMTHRRILSVFSGEVLIREEEPETSYLDYMAVEVITRDGNRHVLAAASPELAAIDGTYLIMREGDAEVVAFELPGTSDYERIELLAHGYYEPDQQ